MRKKYFPLAVVVFVVLTACPSKKNEVAAPLGSTSDTADATSTASPGGSALVPEAKAGTTVIVTLNDNTLDVANPDQIPPGPAVFTITNSSKTNVHNLFIDGPGIQKAAGNDMSPGQVANMNVDLKVGKYTLYCPLLDHRTKGESIDLIIKSPSAPAPSSMTAPDTSTNGTATKTGT
jgi:hypothetical protein